MGWSEGARTAVHVAGKGQAAKVNRMILLAACTRMHLAGTNAMRGYSLQVAELFHSILLGSGETVRKKFQITNSR